jgi:UDP-glucuronate 4-epimerase
VARVLVTGAGGFIGSHLCEALLRRGDEVVGLDNFDTFYDPAVKRRNLTVPSADRGFSLLEGDIRDLDTVRSALQGCQAVVHLAARAGVRPSIEQPLLYQDVNINGTMVILEACRIAEVAKVIFASSSSVYGNNEKVPFSENDTVDYPISPYAATKKAGELLCHTYHHLYDMSISCLRFFTVFGPRQRPDLAIHKFVRLIESGQSIPVFGDGSMRRDFTYIDDIVDGVCRALDRCSAYHIYNLGNSNPVRLSDLIAHIEDAMGCKADLDRRPLQPGDVQRTYADPQRSREELGFDPQTDIATGLRQFVAWFREQGAHT